MERSLFRRSPARHVLLNRAFGLWRRGADHLPLEWAPGNLLSSLDTARSERRRDLLDRERWIGGRGRLQRQQPLHQRLLRCERTRDGLLLAYADDGGDCLREPVGYGVRQPGHLRWRGVMPVEPRADDDRLPRGGP